MPVFANRWAPEEEFLRRLERADPYLPPSPFFFHCPLPTGLVDRSVETGRYTNEVKPPFPPDRSQCVGPKLLQAENGRKCPRIRTSVCAFPSFPPRFENMDRSSRVDHRVLPSPPPLAQDLVDKTSRSSSSCIRIRPEDWEVVSFDQGRTLSLSVAGHGLSRRSFSSGDVANFGNNCHGSAFSPLRPAETAGANTEEGKASTF